MALLIKINSLNLNRHFSPIVQLFGRKYFKSQNIFALAVWRSGHRIRLRNYRPGFKSHQGIRFFREIIAIPFCIIDFISIVLYDEKVKYRSGA
jgi:hypothetical protein